jgi:transcriptional regulator with XRE-family HTH domain
VTEREPLPADAKAQLDEMEHRVGQAVRTVLAEAGVSQEALGRAMGKSQAAVSHMLTKRTVGITVREVAAIEAALRLDPGHIFRLADAFGALWTRPDNVDVLLLDDPDLDPHAVTAIYAALTAARAEGRRERKRL